MVKLTIPHSLIRKILLILAISIGWTQSSFASITIQLGPASVGNGGPNPLSIPPTSLHEYEIIWLRKNHSEFSFSIFPGIFYGYRSIMKSGGYISLGGGIVSDANGLTMGIYNSFGIQKCSFLCFNIEYKQALGLYGGTVLAPYAIRIGVSL